MIALLNIASTHSFTIIPHTFPYPVTKHALLGMTKSLALEYADRGIRVNALAPGYVKTQKNIDYWNSFANPTLAKADTLALQLRRKLLLPQFFWSRTSAHSLNATCLIADGGLSVLHHPL